MKKLIYLFLLLVFASCQNDNFETGIHGIIEYGEGDCSMPEDARNYEKYTGDIYFIEKSKLDTTSSQDFFDLFQISTVVTISDGKLRSELLPGEYVMMVKDFYYVDPENTITITETVIIEKNIKFFKCLSK